MSQIVPEAPQRSLILWLPMPPRETNVRHGSHWSKRHVELKAYQRELAWRSEARYHLPPPPPRPFARARLVACFYFKHRGHFMDRDNITARLKRPIDWLRRSGYIAGDRADQLVYEIPEQWTFTGNEPELCSLRIELTELRAASAQPSEAA